jgi:DNA excision repair protein ERCC-1
VYKQYEHKPPNLIRERVDKDYESVLRTALTSISKVNKTDVETLRTSFGVRTTTTTSGGVLER